ncbi:carbohydrate sulfotransferase 9-like [Ascaphus truei]|uniref:carbohydrate sulfotransferase 9-like n=1 Tax=Ascaphus truei TaxID=8439 RepID=UPI003F592509
MVRDHFHHCHIGTTNMRRLPSKLYMYLLLSGTLFILTCNFHWIQHPWDTVPIKISTVQNHRKNILKSVCLKNNLNNSGGQISNFVAHRLFVEHNHKFIFCEVPKVGCSNWKRIILLLQMNLGIEANVLKHDDVHTTTLLKRLSDYPPKRQRDMLNNYTKVMFTRDPLQRLVSAYRDKLLHSEPYYSITFANIIKSKVRKTQDFKENVTFEEFIRYILQENPQDRDIHWMPMFQLCHPCNIKYDILGKFETMKQDADHVLKTIAAPKALTYPSIRHYSNESRTNENTTSEYFRNLTTTLELLGRLVDIYRLDFSMFEYSPIDL